MFYVVALIFFVASLPAIFGKREEIRDIFPFRTVVVLLIIWTGLRKTSVFPDMPNYESFFYYGQFYITWADVESVNMGYKWLNVIFQWTTNSFQVFVFLVTLLILFCFAKTIERYSPYLFLSLLVFAIVDFPFSCFLLRQYLVVAVCLLSVPFIIQRDIVRFFLYILLAVSFHSAAVVFVPLYFLYRKEVTHSHKVWIYTGFGTATVLGGLIMAYVASLLSTYYQHYFVAESSGSMARLIMKVYFLFLYLYVLRQKVWETGINQVVLYMSLMAVFICAIGVNFSIFFRIRMIMSLSEIIGIPLIIKYSKSMSQRNIFLVDSMIIVYLAVLAISFNSALVNNSIAYVFSFFWN